MNLAMHVLNNLQKYERVYPSLQPDILITEKPKDIRMLLMKDKHKRSSSEQQLINAWRHWRENVWNVERENESRLRLLFRALLIFSHEIDHVENEKEENKISGCISLINSFLFDIWNIRDAIDYVVAGNYLPLTKTANRVHGMSSDWRDPIGAC